MTLAGLKHYISNPKRFFEFAASRNMLNWLSDECFLKIAFRLTTGKPLDLDNPKTFNEKLQWLKINDRRPEYTVMVDKYAVKDYVAKRIGEEYIIPTLGVWDRVEDIDFDSLPDQFVLKCTHDSGGLVICKDKSKLDMKEVEYKLGRSLQSSYFRMGREWPYKNVPRRIIAEKYMVDESGTELKDYKFFSFNGVAKVMFVATDRNIEGVEPKTDFFDMEFNHLPFTGGHPNSTRPVYKPKNFDEMKDLAEKLSWDIPHARVDFYEADGRVYFGEITLYHWGGMMPFKPADWDATLGSWLDLSLDDSCEKNH